MSNLNDPLKEKFRTTDAIDQEVDAALSGVDVDSLMAVDKAQPAQAPTEPTRPGEKQVRHGTISAITKEWVLVDLGGKSQGVVPTLQFEDVEPVVGTEMEFVVDRYDQSEGLLLLSRKGAVAQNVSWENLEVGQVVECTVTGMNKGGLEVDVKGMRGFMPAGQVDLYFQKDLSTLIGQKVQAEVTKFEREARNLVLSRRVILEREKEEKKKVLVAELAEGQVRRGVVRSVTDFGAFVDLGGADGLLHVSEMTFRRGVKPSEVVKVGDALDVKILKFDREAGKISLSLKQARGVDPWADVEAKYAPGTTITGRVVKLENFGAFIEVEEGLEGLLPISEMSYKRIPHPSAVVKEGDTVKLVVLSVDGVQRRISFSLKQAGPNPWADINDRYAVHSVVQGTVTRVADFGAFVELEPGLEGLVHISELAPNRVTTVSSVVQPGQPVSVRVLEVDPENRRVSLSIKRAAESYQAPSGAARSGGASGGGATAAAPATPAAPKKPHKRPLRGGLDF